MRSNSSQTHCGTAIIRWLCVWMKRTRSCVCFTMEIENNAMRNAPVAATPLFVDSLGLSDDAAGDGPSTDQLLDQTAQSNRAMLQSARSDTRVVQRVGGAWLGAHAVPIQNDATLPDIFHRTDFRFQFGKGNIMTIAEKLTQVTHIPVRVQPD